MYQDDNDFVMLASRQYPPVMEPRTGTPGSDHRPGQFPGRHGRRAAHPPSIPSIDGSSSTKATLGGVLQAGGRGFESP
jgi:hypothetical protein